jgi:hypothetical protein
MACQQICLFLRVKYSLAILESISPRSPITDICSGASIERIISVSTNQDVVASLPAKVIITPAAHNAVIAITADYSCIVPRVVAGCAQHQIISGCSTTKSSTSTPNNVG